MYIADRLTESELGFSFYFTDMTYDNIAVNRDGKIVIIDLEDILIVDKAELRRGNSFVSFLTKYSNVKHVVQAHIKDCSKTFNSLLALYNFCCTLILLKFVLSIYEAK